MTNWSHIFQIYQKLKLKRYKKNKLYIKMTRLAQKSSEEDSMYIYWNKCVSNMYNQIKENKLVDEFLKVDIENKGFMFNDQLIVEKINMLTDMDGHSGASFSCCCHTVYYILLEEIKKEKQRLRAQFRGIVKSIIKLKKLRLKAAENIYAPGGIGFLQAEKDFNYNINQLPTTPKSSIILPPSLPFNNPTDIKMM